MGRFLLYKHKVQYYETDMMGIVHNSNYLRWFEESRSDWLEQIGFGYVQMEAQGLISPVLSTACQYKRMVRYGQTVIIVPMLTQYNGVKMTVTYHILDEATKDLCAQGETTHCFLDAVTQFPARLKKTHPDLDALFMSQLGVELQK